MVIDAAPVRVAHRLSVAASIMSPMELWSMAFLMCISQPVAPVRPTASIARLPIRGTTTDQRHGIAAWPLPDHQLPAHRPGISLRDTRRCTLRHRHQLGEKDKFLPQASARILSVRACPFGSHVQLPGTSLPQTPFEELDATLGAIANVLRSPPRVDACQYSNTRKLILVLRTATCSSHMAS